MVKNKWTKTEIELLKKLYSDNFNKDISLLMGKPLKSIISKAYRLKLKKSPKLLNKRNLLGVKSRVINGEFCEYNYEILKNIAKKYKTKIDFIKNDYLAYQASRYRGILNDICQHMTTLKFSTPQLILRDIVDNLLESKSSYNNRVVISPYEIDLWYEQYNLGFEYQGIFWHKERKTDKIKHDLMKQKGINILYIYEYNDRDYEKEIKKQLIDQITELNKITKKNITKDDILNYRIKNVYNLIYNKEELINIAKNYTYFSDFKKKENSVYRKLLKLNLIDISTSHMEDKKYINKYTKDYINKIINKYDNLTDLRKQEKNLYNHIKRNKLSYLISHLKTKKKFNDDEISHTISKYERLCDFIKDNYKMYKYLKRNKFKIDYLKILKDCRYK